MKILFVVHRAYPYNGGSEYNVKLISENLANIGYDVSVLTDVLNGDYGNVKVISNRNVIFTDVYDWIIVHGNDMPVQDFVLNNTKLVNATKYVDNAIQQFQVYYALSLILITLLVLILTKRESMLF
jgi:hypothetical protein